MSTNWYARYRVSALPGNEHLHEAEEAIGEFLVNAPEPELAEIVMGIFVKRGRWRLEGVEIPIQARMQSEDDTAQDREAFDEARERGECIRWHLGTRGPDGSFMTSQVIREMPKASADKEESEEAPTEGPKHRVACATHGEQGGMVVCTHNAEKVVQFNSKSVLVPVSGQSPDVWCSECRSPLLGSENWSDNQLEKAAASIVCEKCFWEEHDWAVTGKRRH